MGPDILIQSLRKELAALRGELGLQSDIPHFELGSVSRKSFIEYNGKKGSPLKFDSDHPVVTRLTQTHSDQSALTFLLSATFSVINRELDDIEDHHEREFHARLLSRLLESDAAAD